MAYRLSRRAQSDLQEISLYTLRQWGDAQAENYYQDILERLRLVAAEPLHPASRARGGLAPGCRVMTVGKHAIFYCVGPTQVEILRILHQRMLLSTEKFQ